MFLTGQNFRQMALFGLIGLFAAVQLALVWTGGENEVFNSPDANANYHFAKRIFQGQSFSLALPLAPSFAQNHLATRSTRAVGGSLVPVGFTGLLVLYGLISKVLFINVIPYLTIVFASIGLYFFYRMVRVLSPGAALLSVFLLATHPAWWYYTNDSLLPNVLFASLAIASAYFFIRMPTGNLGTYVTALALLMMALYVRTSEALWLLPLAIVYAIFAWTRLNRSYLLLLTAVGMGAVAFAWYGLTRLVHSDLPFGYLVPQALGSSPHSTALTLLLPFGFHPRLILLHAWQYLVAFFWPYALALLVAVVASAKDFLNDRRFRGYVLAYAATSLVIVLFYGSFQVADSPDPSAVTIGTSFVRYFLPIYIGGIPLIAHGWVRLKNILRKRYAPVSYAAMLLLLIFSFERTHGASLESIGQKKKTLAGYDVLASWVRANLPDDAIVVTQKSDKYVWPHRLVLTAYEGAGGRQAIAYFLIREGRPLYFMDQTLSEEKRRTLTRLWSAHGLTLGQELFSRDRVSVYEIVRVPPP